MTRKAWGGFVLVVGLGLAVFLSFQNRFVPGIDDVKDPLGRPSALSLEVIHSASEFDRLTGELVPKHGRLSQRIQTLTLVASDLDVLVGDAGDLPALSLAVNDGTTKVGDIAKPLPPLIGGVTGRAQEATPVVGGLGQAVSGVTTQLEHIHGGLRSVYASLAALGPRATTIVRLLAEIERDSERVRAAGPLLSVLADALNSTGANRILTVPVLVDLLNSELLERPVALLGN